jgi:hypothetical protein
MQDYMEGVMALAGMAQAVEAEERVASSAGWPIEWR